MLKQAIFDAIKTQGVVANGKWTHQAIMNFYSDLNPIQKEEFDEVIKSLCEEGILEYHKVGIEIYFLLTSKGVKVIYN